MIFKQESSAYTLYRNIDSGTKIPKINFSRRNRTSLRLKI